MSISRKPAPKKPKGTQKHGGDPIYTIDDFRAVCEVIASRDISMTAACASEPHFMDEVTFWRMMSTKKEARELYQSAKFYQTEVKASYIEYMVKEHPSTYVDAAGIERVDAGVLRAKIDVVKWSVACNNPKKFHIKNNRDEISAAQVSTDIASIVKELNEKNKKEY